MAKQWSDLSRGQRTAVVLGGAADLTLKALMVRDLRRRPADQVRGPKQAWFASTLLGSAGLVQIGYFLFGRRRA